MDKRIFARFHLDAGIGDVVMEPLENYRLPRVATLCRHRNLARAMIAREQQFAEKVHAYTLSWSSPNGRVKDLVDIALLIESGSLDKRRALDALHLTFERRGTHRLTGDLVQPPANWQIPSQALAKECGLSPDVTAAFRAAERFFKALLAARTN
ncbi:MAG TPA: nucleotidyl transferase AbiEii/AbiGii toxin family protein [Terriglobales bacterium]|jgi:hypothetical protein